MNDQQDATKLELADHLKSSRVDAIHAGVRIGLESIPVFGGVFGEVFSTLVTTPALRRRDQFLMMIFEGLRSLEQKVEGFQIDDLANNEAFTSTLLEATQAAIRTHRQEKRAALRNAVLNSALSKNNDDSKEKIFIQLINDLTVPHLQILAMFKAEQYIPTIDLSDPDWKMNIKVDELGNWIEAAYPEMKGQFGLYLFIIQDLYTRGLIANIIPARGMMSEIPHHPVLTSVGSEFLKFIEIPIETVSTDR
jgi:hypothetical protein